VRQLALVPSNNAKQYGWELAFDSKNERHYTAVAVRNCLGLETASARANWLEAYERTTSQAAEVSLCLLSYENQKQNYAPPR
jgi:hypothetical protein